MGMIQHHFPSTSELLLASLRTGLEDLQVRIERRISETLPLEGPQAIVKAIALAHLDDDPATARLLRALAHFRPASAHDASALSMIKAHEERQIAAIAGALEQAQEHRLLHPAVDPAMEAPAFWALITTLATDAALGLRSRDDARALLRYQFGRLARSRRHTRHRQPAGRTPGSDPKRS